MNYQKIYKCIINKRKFCIPEGYTEKHHILPRCLGGSNNKSNLVRLTAREHFICHLLLVKIYKHTQYFYKAINMFMMILVKSSTTPRYMNSRWYEIFRKDISNTMSILQKGTSNSQYNTTWVSNLKTKKSIKIHKSDLEKYLTAGYIHKRIIDFDKYFQKENTKLQKKEDLKTDFIRKVEIYTKLYTLYNQKGWKNFVKITKYKYSRQNLIHFFKKYVKEFVPKDYRDNV